MHLYRIFHKAGSPVPKLASAGYVMHIVLKGRKAMPLATICQTVADVVNGVRSHFSNRFKGEVKAADVQAMRQQ